MVDKWLEDSLLFIEGFLPLTQFSILKISVIPGEKKKQTILHLCTDTNVDVQFSVKTVMHKLWLSLWLHAPSLTPLLTFVPANNPPK